MYDESPEILRYLEEWTAPTKAHVPDVDGNFDPIPSGYLNGLGEMQTQHTCLLLEEVVQECNLKCPTCFASSGPGGAGIVPVEQVLANVDQRLRRENDHLDVVMVSGGEPTLHPQILPLLREIAARPVNRILLNTNGIRLAKDDELLDVPPRPPRPRGGLPPVRRAAGRDVTAPARRRRGALQGAGGRPAVRGRGLHHADDDRRPRGQRRRDRGGRPTLPRHALRGRRQRAAGVRVGARHRHRPARPSDTRRRSHPARPADRRGRGLARPDGAAVFAPALLQHRLPAAHRRGRSGGRWRGSSATSSSRSTSDW